MKKFLFLRLLKDFDQIKIRPSQPDVSLSETLDETHTLLDRWKQDNFLEWRLMIKNSINEQKCLPHQARSFVDQQIIETRLIHS